MAKPVSGKNGYILAEDVRLCLNEWSVDRRATGNVPLSTFDSNYAIGVTSGLELLTWDFSGDWDSERDPFEYPPGIFPREDMALELGLTQDSAWHVPNALVLSARNSCAVRGKVLFSASGRSNGEFN